MRIDTIRIPCKDLVQSEQFYVQQMGWQKTFGSAAEGFIGLQLESVTILLEPEEAGEFEAGRYLGFSLAVDDLMDCYHKLQAQDVAFIGTPETQEWGGIMAHVQDCNGNSFSLVQHLRSDESES